MAKKNVNFMCTAFRDGFQSVYGARVLTEDFMPAVAAAREAGITYFEAGGGAMFQSPYFYCNEDSFHMMDRFREVAGPDANLQTLARGVNIVCLDSASSDVIRLHAKLFKKHGITTIRNFDALNDVNNLIFSGRCIHEAGLKHQVVVTMMALPPGCTGGEVHVSYVRFEVGTVPIGSWGSRPPSMATNGPTATTLSERRSPTRDCETCGAVETCRAEPVTDAPTGSGTGRLRHVGAG